MAAAPISAFTAQSWSERLWLDLQPAPGRLAATLRIVLATVVAVVLMMVLQLPFASLGLYFIFLLVRENPAMTVKSGVVTVVTLILAIAVELAVVIVSDNDPAVRLISVGVATFISGMIMAASTQPALGAIWGLVYTIVIAFWERPAPSDTLVRSSLYLVATVSLAFGCAVLVEYLFAYRNASDRLSEQVAMRYRTVEGVFTLFAQGVSGPELAEAILRLNRMAATGQRGMLELFNIAIEHRASATKLPAGSRTRIAALAQFMDVAAAFASQYPEGVEPEQRGRCAEIARRIRERGGKEPPHQEPSRLAPHLLDRVEAVLHNLLEAPDESGAGGEQELAPLPADKVPFFIPGALTNKDAVAFALKMTLCAMICYIFYWAVAWPGISTSVTTVFITAVGNSGAIKQKMLNRFLGSAIGGGLAILATAFIFPQMDSIFSLVLLIGAVAFVSAWWGGGRQFGYAGLQIAFSFYIVAFEGFSAPTELAPARDRLAGIAFALVVIWLVFDQIWPVRTVTAMRRSLAGIFKGQARCLRIFESGAPAGVRMNQVDALRDQIGKAIAGLRTLNDSVVYEFGADREAHIRLGDAILRTALRTVPFFWNQLSVLHNQEDEDFLSEPGLTALRRKLAPHLDQMAGAVAANAPVVLLPAEDLADATLLANPRFGEYATNTIERHDEVQNLAAKLYVGGNGK